MSCSVHFFATSSDLRSIIVEVESKQQLRYCRAGMFDSPDVLMLPSGLEIPHLGLSLSGDQNLEPWWLVLLPGTDVTARAIPQRGGGTRYAIDQLSLPESLAFRPGGTFGECVIAGQAGMASDNPVSRLLFDLFSSEIRQHFRRIKSYFVGPDAERLLKKGCRLTSSVKSSRERDLAL